MFFGEDEYYLEIATDKYLDMKLNELRALCNKFRIELSYGLTKKTIALNVLPTVLQKEDFLEDFYGNLPKEQQEILKFIVNYNGDDLKAKIKKVFNFDILLKKYNSRDIYVWWLELFVHNDTMDPDIKEYYFEFLHDKSFQKSVNTKDSLPSTTSNIDKITVEKHTTDNKLLKQKLTPIEPVDIVSDLKILCKLCSDGKIIKTIKGALTKKTEKLLDESLEISYGDYTKLLNFLINLKYIRNGKQLTPTQKSNATMLLDNGDIVKMLLQSFLSLRYQYEFRFMIIDTRSATANHIVNLRTKILDIIKKQNCEEWISVDYITSQIPKDNITLKELTNGSLYCYCNRSRNRTYYNRLEDLESILRFYIKAFVFSLYKLGIFSLARTKLICGTTKDLEVLNIRYIDTSSTIEYFKLTEVGKYALKISKKYTVKDGFQIELSPYLLEISVKNPSNLSDIFLQNITKKIDDTKYTTDIKTFLLNINSKKEFENAKKSLISKVKTTPKIWSDFFQTIEKRISSTNIVSKDATLIKLPNDKELLNFIATHQKLKQKILKADNLHIVVLKDHLPYVKKAFKEFGVLI